MARLAFFADSQVDEHSRLAEHDRVCGFVVRDAAARGCGVLLHGGDVFERRSTVRERDSVWAWLDAAVAEGMVVGICGGNHEAPGEVVELDNPAAGVYAYEVPAVRVIGDGPSAVAVAFLPWPRRASIARWLESLTGAAPSRESVSLAARELLRDVLRGLGAQLADAPPDVPRVLLAHVQLSGSKTDPDQPSMVGVDMEISLEDLMLSGADAVLLGHIHLPQEWEVARLHDGACVASDSLPSADNVVGVPVIYAGSPRRTAYAAGELVQKGYVVLEFEGRRLVRWERVPTPATPLILVDARWETNGVVIPGREFLVSNDDPWPQEIPVGAEIRLRYSVAGDQRDAARRAAEAQAADWRTRGAAEVKVDEVVEATARVRAPDVATAPTLRDALEAVWRSQGADAPAEHRRAHLLSMADSVLEEVRS